MYIGNKVRWILLVLVLVFSVYCYNHRNAHNTDTLSKANSSYQYDAEVYEYVISLVPDDVKNEVYINSIKEKFPEIEKQKELFESIGGKFVADEDATEEKTEKVSIKPSDVMNIIADEMKEG